jgi:hypothetical protein
MNSIDIKKSLAHAFHNYQYKLYNTYVFGWESDFFAISRSGYSIEVEIKISRGDFKNDFKKTHFNNIPKHDFIADITKVNKPNKLYFACPDGLIKSDEIPIKYGLIYVKDNCAKVIKEAKYLHKEKILDSFMFVKILLNKFYYRNIDLRMQLETNEFNIKYGQKKLNFYNY